MSCSPLGGGGHPRSLIDHSSLEAEGRAMKPFLSSAGGNAGREPAEVSRWRGRACMCGGRMVCFSECAWVSGPKNVGMFSFALV